MSPVAVSSIASPTRGVERTEPCAEQNYQPDADATSCPLCEDEFTVLTRRHHCRWCGGVACAKCTENRHRLKEDSSKKQRVCTDCEEAAAAFESNLRAGEGDDNDDNASDTSVEDTPRESPMPTPKPYKKTEAIARPAESKKADSFDRPSESKQPQQQQKPGRALAEPTASESALQSVPLLDSQPIRQTSKSSLPHDGDSVSKMDAKELSDNVKEVPQIDNEEQFPALPDVAPIASVKEESLKTLSEKAESRDSLHHDKSSSRAQSKQKDQRSEGKEALKQDLAEGKEKLNEGKQNLKENLADGKEKLVEGKENLKENLAEGKQNLKENLAEGKEKLNEGKQNLKENLSEGKQNLKENLSEGKQNLKKNLAEGKEKLNEGKENLKENLADGKEQLKENLAEGKENLEEQKKQLAEGKHCEACGLASEVTAGIAKDLPAFGAASALAVLLLSIGTWWTGAAFAAWGLFSLRHIKQEGKAHSLASEARESKVGRGASERFLHASVCLGLLIISIVLANLRDARLLTPLAGAAIVLPLLALTFIVGWFPTMLIAMGASFIEGAIHMRKELH